MRQVAKVCSGQVWSRGGSLGHTVSKAFGLSGVNQGPANSLLWASDVEEKTKNKKVIPKYFIAQF